MPTKTSDVSSSISTMTATSTTLISSASTTSSVNHTTSQDSSTSTSIYTTGMSPYNLATQPWMYAIYATSGLITLTAGTIIARHIYRKYIRDRFLSDDRRTILNVEDNNQPEEMRVVYRGMSDANILRNMTTETYNFFRRFTAVMNEGVGFSIQDVNTVCDFTINKLNQYYSDISINPSSSRIVKEEGEKYIRSIIESFDRYQRNNKLDQTQILKCIEVVFETLSKAEFLPYDLRQRLEGSIVETKDRLRNGTRYSTNQTPTTILPEQKISQIAKRAKKKIKASTGIQTDSYVDDLPIGSTEATNPFVEDKVNIEQVKLDLERQKTSLEEEKATLDFAKLDVDRTKITLEKEIINYKRRAISLANREDEVKEREKAILKRTEDFKRAREELRAYGRIIGAYLSAYAEQEKVLVRHSKVRYGNFANVKYEDMADYVLNSLKALCDAYDDYRPAILDMYEVPFFGFAQEEDRSNTKPFIQKFAEDLIYAIVRNPVSWVTVKKGNAFQGRELELLEKARTVFENIRDEVYGEIKISDNPDMDTNKRIYVSYITHDVLNPAIKEISGRINVIREAVEIRAAKSSPSLSRQASQVLCGISSPASLDEKKEQAK